VSATERIVNAGHGHGISETDGPGARGVPPEHDIFWRLSRRRRRRRRRRRSAAPSPCRGYLRPPTVAPGPHELARY